MGDSGRARERCGLLVLCGATVSGLILEGVRRVRKVKPRARDWNAKKERTFLSSLTETCNVKLSAKRAGVSPNCVYERRNKNATFRASWDAALSTGYAQLEMMMLERALHGVAKTVTSKDGTTTTMREYSDRTALALLRMHRDNAHYASEGNDSSELEEARERIVERLSRLREQDEIETKAVADRLGVIKWALERQ
jgi:hypothetical protein